MPITSYSELQSAVNTWLARSLTDYVPDFIAVAEASLRRRPELQESTHTTFTISAETMLLPSNCNIVKELYWDESTARGPIELKGVAFMAEQKARLFGATGRPRYAAILNHGTVIKFSPVPDQTYTAILHYETKLPALSATQTTNWLLTSHPDIYLYGSLLASAPFLKDDERLPMWQRLYEQALEELRLFEHRRNNSLGTLVRKPARAIG